MNIYNAAMSLNPIHDYVVTEHAHFEMQRRSISEDQIDAVLKSPQQSVELRKGRWVLQSKFTQSQRQFLIRVFVDVDRAPAEVVTAYKTSKIEKYWR